MGGRFYAMDDTLNIHLEIDRAEFGVHVIVLRCNFSTVEVSLSLSAEVVSSILTRVGFVPVSSVTESVGT